VGATARVADSYSAYVITWLGYGTSATNPGPKNPADRPLAGRTNFVIRDGIWS
jgi:hypothetical protein